MKKIILSALAGTAMLAIAGTANAGSTTANAGLTFVVGSSCTVTGQTANLGNYFINDTAVTYAARQGNVTTAGALAAAGTDTAAPIASVNCPASTPWTLAINGTNSDGTMVMKDGNAAPAFNVVAYATAVGSTAVTKFLNSTGNAANVVTGTGTGAAQAVNGFFPAYITTGAQQAAGFTAGQYSATAVATLTY